MISIDRTEKTGEQTYPNGLHVIVNAVLTVLAIAMGVLVGSGVVASTRR